MLKTRISYLGLVTGLLLLINAGCAKLEESPEDFVGPDNFYTTPAQIESAFASSMNRLWGGWQFYDWYRYPQIWDMDDQVYEGNLVIGENFGSGAWNNHYRAIADLNPAIGAIKRGNLKNVSEEEKNQLLAQARFLRGWNYFFLVRYYGDIPIITENTDVVAGEITRAPVAQVYDTIVADLEFAVEHLPPQWDAAKKAAPTQDAAKGILAEVNITMATAPLNNTSRYTQARALAKEIMDSARYSLVPNVADVFKLENKFGPEFMWSFHNTPDEYVIEPQIWLPGEMAGGWGDIKTEKRWGEAFPDEPRKDAYLLLEGWEGDTYLDWWGNTPYVKKYLYDSRENLEKNVSYHSQPIIRYAEVLLIFAEAENAINGPTAAAVDAVNQIINRATGGVPNPADPLATTSMTKEAFDALVIQQRNWELCFEYDRWFDIQRKRLLPTVTDPIYLPNYSPEDYLLPIPEKDLRLNKKMVQNPGYPTPEQ